MVNNSGQRNGSCLMRFCEVLDVCSKGQGKLFTLEGKEVDRILSDSNIWKFCLKEQLFITDNVKYC